MCWVLFSFIGFKVVLLPYTLWNYYEFNYWYNFVCSIDLKCCLVPENSFYVCQVKSTLRRLDVKAASPF